jgi:hypothetical protein
MKKIYLIAGMWAALFCAKAQQVATFDDFELEPDSWYNGSDEAGGFGSGGFWFPNSYNTDWGSWSGFAVSNMKDTATAGYENQFSAITAGGAEDSENYAVVYIPGTLTMNLNEPLTMDGFYITNSTYAYLDMRDGSDYSKKFGGADGSDPDYFKLMVWGVDGTGNETDTVEFFLADFRAENPEDNYLNNTWEWLDLNSLGAITSLKFAMESSDMGDWGMNTPAYFCIDHFTAAAITFSSKEMTRQEELRVYPNPVKDFFYIDVPACAEKLILTKTSGQVLFQQSLFPESRLEVSALNGLPPGIYFLKILTGKGILNQKILKY